MRIRMAAVLIGAFALMTPMTATAVTAEGEGKAESSQPADAAPLAALKESAPGIAHVSNTYNLSRGSCKYWALSSNKWAVTWKSAGGCSGHAWVKFRTKNGYDSGWQNRANVKFLATSGQMLWTKHKTCRDEVECPVVTIHHKK
ncbi:hypothetical protein [Streptomyces boncukensis]|uniref:Uncharacterized protein n=1 Tax=Streptomyces boncukensis TaxID=2711219 RepID=A0A6G4WX09_9ACTN|nr:hypothetical protein [Streptomyces boncukensis]NGO69765.1 hypothetical protein [Streptomyces boncukensis]